MEMVSIEIIEEEILDLEKRDTSYTVCERLAWLYTVRDHLKKPAADTTVMEQRIKAVCPKEYDAVMSQIYALR